MKIFSIIFCCLLAFSGYAQEEQMNRLLSEKNNQVSFITEAQSNTSLANDLISIPFSSDITDYPSKEGVFPATLAQDFNMGAGIVKRKGLAFQSYAITFFLIDGYNFHVADYYDGTRIVTCLNGSMMGYQAISVNGIKTAESTHVKWKNRSFVHRYPAGKVYSYKNKQIIELN